MNGEGEGRRLTAREVDFTLDKFLDTPVDIGLCVYCNVVEISIVT